MKFNLLQGFYPTFCRLSQEFHLINNISHQLFLATLPYSTTRGIVLALRAVYSPIPCLTGQKGISSLCSDIPIALAGRALAQDSSLFRKRKENCFLPLSLQARLDGRGQKTACRICDKLLSCAVKGGFEPPVRKPVRQFSKLLV